MAKETLDKLLELLAKCNPRTRKTVMRVVEGKASQDNAAFIQEQLSFIEQDASGMTVRSVDFISSRTCDYGHLQDQHTRLVAVCEDLRRTHLFYRWLQLHLCKVWTRLMQTPCLGL